MSATESSSGGRACPPGRNGSERGPRAAAPEIELPIADPEADVLQPVQVGAKPNGLAEERLRPPPIVSTRAFLSTARLIGAEEISVKVSETNVESPRSQ